MKRRLERANAAVELALILPLLVVLTLGTVDFGRLFYTYIAVSNAAHQGAIYASRPISEGWDWDGIRLQTVVANETNGVLTTGNFTLSLSRVTGAKVTMARVRVAHNFSPLTPIPRPGPIELSVVAYAPIQVNG